MAYSFRDSRSILNVISRFEKSLYDLIRGLRNHKGKEHDYIQESLRECRKEIKSQDMDLKATALLKLTYLEMFGYDMSWASFNVLEVMSSPKYLRKRVGYLSAIQSFRADTEVLMLAENLLKKDLTSGAPATISLPLIAIPHVINPSMANSLLADLIPRLSHSHPSIRKKTIVTLFRLALVFPETLRPAWPKIKERLLDDEEDPSVTAAILNVVCELGWRRPKDFLPLAPRLFELLVEGSNNWMGIKIIKLFATLTPLEPRLIKKLLPRLTSLIKTTPAMSLLYECINGIIQGGILDSMHGTAEGEELARLCVGKLRGMLMVDIDPNLKYVAILAFQRIVASHPHLVNLHRDVILECIDDPDISIRMRALDLVVRMVNSDNIVVVVDRLLNQLRTAQYSAGTEYPEKSRGMQASVLPVADLNEEEAEESLQLTEGTNETVHLPEEYRVTVIKRILEICSGETYARIHDFEWYINVLIQMVQVSPSIGTQFGGDNEIASNDLSISCGDISYEIGYELQNVAVRVKSVRLEATRAAQSLIIVDQRDQFFPSSGNGGQYVLDSAAWLVGEYADYLSDPSGVLTSLLHPSVPNLPERIIATILQAIPKVFGRLVGDQSASWTREKKSIVTLLLARIINFLEPLTSSPSLEVQERAVQFLELTRLSAEAAEAQEPKRAGETFAEPPLLLTQAIPSLFSGLELNPVAPSAQRKVPIPDDLNLDTPVNPHLNDLLSLTHGNGFDRLQGDESHRFYYQRPKKPAVRQAAADRLPSSGIDYGSYQQSNKEETLDADGIARLKAERQERYKDDPFYIAPESEHNAASPIHDILRSTQSADVDIDSIPVIELEGMDLKYQQSEGTQIGAATVAASTASLNEKPKSRKTVEILVDETLVTDELEGNSLQPPGNDAQRLELVRPTQSRAKKSLLQVDSSGLGALSLNDNGRVEGGEGIYNSNNSSLDVERREAEEAEMARAVQEVERLRLEMQRAAERIQARDAPPEGTLVQKKKKKKRKVLKSEDEGENSISKKTNEVDINDGIKDFKAESNNAKQENGNIPAHEIEVLTKTKKKKRKKREVRFGGEGEQKGT